MCSQHRVACMRRNPSRHPNTVYPVHRSIIRALEHVSCTYSLAHTQHWLVAQVTRRGGLVSKALERCLYILCSPCADSALTSTSHVCPNTIYLGQPGAALSAARTPPTPKVPGARPLGNQLEGCRRAETIVAQRGRSGSLTRRHGPPKASRLGCDASEKQHPRR